MPTLLQINTTLNYGSTGRIAEGIGQLAQAHGWRSLIAHGPRGVNPSQNEAIRVSTLQGTIRHGIFHSLLDNHGLGNRQDTAAFVARIEAIGPDVIHLHNIHGYYLNYPVLFDYLKRVDIPVVWTLHDCWSFTGHCTHFDLIGCRKWQTHCERCPQTETYPRAFVDRSRQNFTRKKELFTALGKRLTLVPVSHWLDGFLQKSFFGNTASRVIHNGIDTQTFSPQGDNDSTKERLGLGDRFTLLGVASQWGKRKGLSDFIELRKRLDPKHYAIMLVGLTEKQRKQLPEGITGICRTQNIEELAALYSCADVFVNPTYEDNYPTVNLEAISCGTPVITYRTGGSPESVCNSTGLVVAQGDIDALAAAIESIRSTGKARYTAACRQHALEHFDKQERFANYFTLYNELLSQY